MVLEEKNKIENTNIDNFNSFKVNISSVAIKAMIDMYEDKELAVVRELLTNAWDSHIVAGNTDTPIDVDLFHTNPNIFRIRDYGTGISEEDMQDYCTIYHSSKRESNDQTGCWGVGSKVPFAIVDNYIVSSYYNGTKLTYLMSISDSIPKFSLLSRVETTEPNGLEITITTDREGELYRALSQFIKYVDIKLNILVPNYRSEIKKANVLFETETFKIVELYASEVNKYQLINYGNNIYQINKLFKSFLAYELDNIVDLKYLQDKSNNNTVNKLDRFITFMEILSNSLNNLNLTIIFKVPLSTGLTIIPSREGLENTENNISKIKEFITKALIDYFLSEYTDTFVIDYTNKLNYNIKYKPLKLLSIIILHADKVSTQFPVYRIADSKCIKLKQSIYEYLYPFSMPENEEFSDKTDSIIVFSPEQVFNTNRTSINPNSLEFSENSSLNTSFFNLLYFYNYWSSYENNLRHTGSSKKVLILNTRKITSQKHINFNIITKLKQLCNFKKTDIYYHFNTYDLIILVNNTTEYEIAKPVLKFIKQEYGLDLHYYEIGTLLNIFRTVKKELTVGKSLSGSFQVNRTKVKIAIRSNSINNHYYNFLLHPSSSDTVKQVITDYQKGIYSNSDFIFLTSSDNTYNYLPYIDNLYTIVLNMDKLPEGFVKKLNKISHKYANRDLISFLRTQFVFTITSKHQAEDKIKEYLQNNIPEFKLKQFVTELVEAIDKLKIYDTNLSVSTIIPDSFNNNTVNKIFSIKNKTILPNKICSSLLHIYSQREPTTKFGKMLFKKLKRIETKYKYSACLYSLNIYGMNKVVCTKHELNNETTVQKIKNIMDYIAITNKIRTVKELLQVIIKYSYRRQK